MLAHQRVATTEARYVEGGAKQATNAQQIFHNMIPDSTSVHTESINEIDCSASIDEYSVLRKLYPYASNEMIYKVMEMMK